MYLLPGFRARFTMSSFVDDNLEGYFENGRTYGRDHWSTLYELLEDAYRLRAKYGCHPSDEGVSLA